MTTLPKRLRSRATVQPSASRVRPWMTTVTVEVPLEIRSEPNLRQHWSKRHGRSAKQRDVVGKVLAATGVPPLPAVVTLTRIGKRLMDTDNAIAALKAVRDEVAAAYGVPDNDPRLIWWHGRQQLGKASAVRIDIATAGKAGGTNG